MPLSVSSEIDELSDEDADAGCDVIATSSTLLPGRLSSVCDCGGGDCGDCGGSGIGCGTMSGSPGVRLSLLSHHCDDVSLMSLHRQLSEQCVTLCVH
eukprot:1968182-Amphidinium_carterae.1